MDPRREPAASAAIAASEPWHHVALRSTRAWMRNGTTVAVSELVVVGELSVEIALWQQAMLDESIARLGAGWAYFDWSGATGFTSAYRRSWQEWIEVRKDAVHGADFLTKSTLLRMAIAVTNLVLPRARFTAHGERASYEAARRKRLADFAGPMPNAR